MSEPLRLALFFAIDLNFVKLRGAHSRFAVEHLDEEPWASVTFTGARHRLRIAFEGPGAVGAAADFLDRMTDLDLPVPGQIVADLALLAEGRSDNGRHACLELEALTIKDI